jgi:hypothetical protein
MSNITARLPEVAVKSQRAVPMTLPVYRLNLMRGGYLLMAIGLTLVKWPLLPQVASLPAIDGAQICILTAVSLLAYLGVRYPIGMLPILVFEVLWKVLWLALVALPHLIANDLSGPTENLLFTILFVVPVIAVTPWDFVWKRFAATPGERWTRTR